MSTDPKIAIDRKLWATLTRELDAAITRAEAAEREVAGLRVIESDLLHDVARHIAEKHTQSEQLAAARKLLEEAVDGGYPLDGWRARVAALLGGGT